MWLLGEGSRKSLVIKITFFKSRESGCRPIASSMISDLFERKRRGLANGIFSLGVMFGYGLSFAIGNYIPLLDIFGLGWRMAFVIGCAPGILLGICMVFIKDQRYQTK